MFGTFSRCSVVKSNNIELEIVPENFCNPSEHYEQMINIRLRCFRYVTHNIRLEKKVYLFTVIERTISLLFELSIISLLWRVCLTIIDEGPLWRGFTVRKSSHLRLVRPPTTVYDNMKKTKILIWKKSFELDSLTRW